MVHSCTSPWHKCLQTDAPPCPCAFVREGRILAEWMLQMPLMTRSIGGGEGRGGSIPLGQDSRLRLDSFGRQRRSAAYALDPRPVSDQRRLVSAGESQTWTRSKPLVVSTHAGCCLSPVLGDNQLATLSPRLSAFCRPCEGLPGQPGTSVGADWLPSEG